ncbi:MAG: hypothetical protein WA748_07780 [Candidatus Acidiferrum sp.]
MTQNLLDDFVGNAEPMKIRGQSAPKRVPAVPRNLLRFECGPNHFTRQQIEIQRVAPEISKNKSLRKISRRSPVPIEKKFQLRDHRNGSFALLPFRLAYLVAPHGVLHFDGVTVIVLPKKSTDFTLAGARECRHRDNRRGGFGKNRQHPNFFLQ